MSQDQTQILADKRALDELIWTHSRATDTHDWDMLRACLTDEIDYFLTEGMGLMTTPEEFIAKSRMVMTGFDSTMHIVTGCLHNVDGDTASSSAYVEAKHFLKNDKYGDSLIGGGIFLFDSVRTETGWKIRKLRLQHMYIDGNPMIFQLAIEKSRAKVGA